MILDHDAIKESYIAEGKSFGEACGKTTREMIEAIENHTGVVVAVFGPPGVGKSHFCREEIRKYKNIPADALIVETSGLNWGVNRALQIRRANDPYTNRRYKRTMFIMLTADRRICEHRIKTRSARPLDKENGREKLLETLNRWFDVYANLANHQYALIADWLISSDGKYWRVIY